MGETKNFVEQADRLAGITTITLVSLGIIQIILGETISKSVALTANGIDCIGDGFVSAVVWGGLKFFRRPADEKFHYGYYKTENLASIAAAIVMIILASYIIFRSYNQFINPSPVENTIFGAAVAFIAAVVAIGLGFYKYFKGKKSRLSSVKLDAFNTIKDGSTSGLTVVALILSTFGFYVADAVIGFIIAGIIVSIGFAAIKESSYTLVDACDGECSLKGPVIKKIAEEIKDVESVEMIRLRRSGPVILGDIEIKVPSKMTIKEFNSIKNRINKLSKEKYSEIERINVTAIIDDEKSE